MATSYSLTAEVRTDSGKGASRRLRRTGKIPAILYGANRDPISIALAGNQLSRNLQEEQFYSAIIDLDLNDKVQKVMLRDLQRHPSRPVILHADLQRVRDDEKVRMNVQLLFINDEECPGVKLEGGKLNKALMDVEISCLPKDIPEHIVVDCAEMHKGDAVHLSTLNLPEGVESVQLSQGELYDLAVATIS